MSNDWKVSGSRPMMTSSGRSAAVSPTVFAPCSHSGSIPVSSSTSRARQPSRSATSTRRCEFDEFSDPITSRRSHSRASAFTASWRFCVA